MRRLMDCTAVGSQQAAVKVEEFPIDEDAAKPEVPGGVS